MSLTQYNNLMSSMLKQKYSLTKLRKELEGRKEKLCFSCKRFGYLAQNYKNKKEAEKGVITLKGCKRELHTGTNKIMMCQLPIVC